MKFKWEAIYQEITGGTTRAKVPGGWIISNIMVVDNIPAMSSVFVYDPEWNWSVEE